MIHIGNRPSLTPNANNYRAFTQAPLSKNAISVGMRTFKRMLLFSGVTILMASVTFEILNQWRKNINSNGLRQIDAASTDAHEDSWKISFHAQHELINEIGNEFNSIPMLPGKHITCPTVPNSESYATIEPFEDNTPAAYKDLERNSRPLLHKYSCLGEIYISTMKTTFNSHNMPPDKPEQPLYLTLQNSDLAAVETTPPPELEQLLIGLHMLKHFEHISIQNDGNCLFGAISQGVYGSETNRDQLRQLCCDELIIDDCFAEIFLETSVSEQGIKDYFEGWCLRTAEAADEKWIGKDRSSVVAEGRQIINDRLKNQLNRDPTSGDFYREFMRQDTSHGGETEIITLSKALKRPILVFKTTKAGQKYVDANQKASLFGEEFKGATPLVIHNIPGHFNAYVPKQQYG
jgi:hypothetical protein